MHGGWHENKVHGGRARLSSSSCGGSTHESLTFGSMRSIGSMHSLQSSSGCLAGMAPLSPGKRTPVRMPLLRPMK